MAYLALYRRFRPQTFDEMVGQNAVVQTLKNQIKTDRIGHAYLFCGARGTGKTTAARVFARAVNCLSPAEGSPCGKCAACLALSGANMDVVEMDAASNNGVDEVRNLKESVQYPPVSCRYKVYIVDEVHMLSQQAFNALLKTLEEPPKHAVFILATTEPQKLPATILSRCMRFDFKLVETPVIADLVGNIYKEIGKEYEKEAVMAIAKAGNGSFRDALSIADVCLSYSAGKLTYADVTAVLGAADRDKTLRFACAVLSGKDGEALSEMDGLLKNGKNVFLLAKDAADVLRDLLIVKNCRDAGKILNYPEEELNKLRAAAENFEAGRLIRTVEIFSELDGKMRYSASPRTVFEAAVFKAALPDADFDFAALLYRVNVLSEEVKELRSALSEGRTVSAETVQAAPEKKAETRAVNLPEEPPRYEDIPLPEPEPSAPAEEKPAAKPRQFSGDPIPSGRLFGTFIRALRAAGKNMLWVACAELKSAETETQLVLFADETTYGVLCKENNFASLKETLLTISPKELAVQKTAAKPDSFQEDVKKLENTFGGDYVTFKR